MSGLFSRCEKHGSAFLQATSNFIKRVNENLMNGMLLVLGLSEYCLPSKTPTLFPQELYKEAYSAVTVSSSNKVSSTDRLVDTAMFAGQIVWSKHSRVPFVDITCNVWFTHFFSLCTA